MDDESRAILFQDQNMRNHVQRLRLQSNVFRGAARAILQEGSTSLLRESLSDGLRGRDSLCLVRVVTLSADVSRRQSPLLPLEQGSPYLLTSHRDNFIQVLFNAIQSILIRGIGHYLNHLPVMINNPRLRRRSGTPASTSYSRVLCCRLSLDSQMASLLTGIKRPVKILS